MRAFLRIVASTALLLSAAPLLASGSGAIPVIPYLIGDHELVAEFAVGSGCGQVAVDPRAAVVPGTAGPAALSKLGFKGLDDCYEGEMYLVFEDPEALLSGSLEITVEEVDTDDANLLSRLPSSSVLIPDEFPVLIRIVDNSDDGFTFNRLWEMEIETRELNFDARSPLRLFRADEGCPPPGCAFEDSTFSSGFGSYRVRGAFGTFSEFLIAADLRPKRAVVSAKIASLSQAIDDFESDGSVLPAIATQLNNELDAAQLAISMGDLEGAFIAMIQFAILVETNIGNGIEDVWDPTLDEVSAAGVLLGGIQSTIFSLEVAAQPDPVSTGGVSKTLTTDPSSFRLDVTISFDQATDLQADALYVDAFEIDPLDSGLLSRLPAGVGIDPTFPVLFVIGADSFSRPAARGDWQVTMRTRDLSFRQGSPFRLLKALTNTGNFVDVTDQLGIGSLVARASVAEFDQFAFSEYLVARDTRNNNVVAGAKFARIQAFLDTLSIDAGVAAQLAGELQAALSSFTGGDPTSAILRLDAFIAIVEANAGTELLDIWRADDPRVNEAGRLTSLAKTLQFSLAIEESPLESDPADVNRDGFVDNADVFAVIESVFCPGGCAQPPLLPPAPEK